MLDHPALVDRPQVRLSRRVTAIAPARSIAINQLVYDLKAQGHDIVTLSLGEAYFEVPLFDFSSLDQQACNHYTDSRGIAALRRRIAAFYEGYYDAVIDPASEVLVTAGSKLGVYIAMQAILDPGDEVLVHEPAWLSYPEQAALCGATTRAIPYAVAPPAFERYFSDRTRLLIVNNPNNPAGRVYGRAELTALYERCRASGVFLLVDEAYSDFVEPGTFTSVAAIARERAGVAVVNSLSKNMGISGWRIGYLIGSAPFIDAALRLNQHLVTCAPSILQHYLAEYFEQIVERTIPQAREIACKRARVTHLIERLGLRQLSGSATFYHFIEIGAYHGTSDDFAQRLLQEHHVAVVPGSAYGRSTDRFVRVSIGTESEERIAGALTRIAALAAA